MCPRIAINKSANIIKVFVAAQCSKCTLNCSAQAVWVSNAQEVMYENDFTNIK